MDVSALQRLLDNAPAAKRVSAGQPVWRAQRRFIDLPRRLRGLPMRDSDSLLAEALGCLLRGADPCFVHTGMGRTAEAFGRGAWRPIERGAWAPPPDIDVGCFVDESELYQEGDYVTYVGARAASAALAALPWFGGEASVAGLIEGLHAMGITAAVAVGPDGDWWTAVLPAGS